MKIRNNTLVVRAALVGLLGAAMSATAQTEAPIGGQKPSASKKVPVKKTAEKVHCFGINSCKGTSECGVDGKSACAGQNACKGQGWISLSRKVCGKKKGTVVGMAAPMAPVTSQAK